MDLSPSNLNVLFTGFNAAFNKGLKETQTLWPTLAMEVPSITAANTYAWLGDLPGIRQWIGDRVVHDLSGGKYTIVNREFEETVSIKRTDIEDDQYGIYGPIFLKFGHNVAKHPDQLLFDLLERSFTEYGPDGQYFFDTDHGVGSGAARHSVSNHQRGSDEAGRGPAWFLFDCSQPIKPFIYQKRTAFDLLRVEEPTNAMVFAQDRYYYGVRGRSNVGYGLWQLAYASQATLNEANYDAARTAMQSFKNDAGQPLGIRPTHLVVPPRLEGVARRLLEGENKLGGESNVWAKTAEIIVCPYLT